MRIRIEIKTPKGQAKSTAGKLRPFILGFHKTLNTVYANKTDDKIIWIVDGEPRSIFAIERNVFLFDKTVKTILTNRTVHKLAKLSPKDRAELKDMFENHTRIRIIKHYDELPNLSEYEKQESG